MDSEVWGGVEKSTKEIWEKLMKVWNAEDKQECIISAYSLVCTDLSKHVEVKSQVMVDNVPNGSMGLQYVLTDAMMADILTKNLEPC